LCKCTIPLFDLWIANFMVTCHLENFHMYPWNAKLVTMKKKLVSTKNWKLAYVTSKAHIMKIWNLTLKKWTPCLKNHEIMLVQIALYPPLTYELQILWYHVTLKNDTFNQEKWYLQPLKIEIFYMWPQNNIPWKLLPWKFENLH
jgi:hypothetical protein